MSEFNFYQGSLIDNVNIYLQQRGLDEQKISGYCNALALLWSYKGLYGEQAECYRLYKLIEQWNGVDDLEIEFEKLVSQLNWVQNNIIGGYALVTDSAARVNILEPQNRLQKEFCVTYTFTEPEVINLLSDLLKNDGKEIIISSHNHTVSVVFKEGVYRFFDSNGGVREFKTVEDFVKHPEFGLIASFTFENNRLANLLDKLNIKKSIPEFLSLDILVLDKEGSKVGKYPQNPIQSIIQARAKNRKDPGVNNRSWSGSFALFQAASVNDVESVQTLLSNHANVNLMNDAGYSALYAAVAQHAKESVKLLLDNGASLSFKYKIGSGLFNILQIASVVKHNTEVITDIVIAAIKDNQIDMLRASMPNLIKAEQIDINKPVSSGETLLQIAIKSGNVQIVSDLLTLEANVNVNDLQIADSTNNDKIKYLIAGELFHKAIRQNDLALAKSLLLDYPDVKNFLSRLTSESPLIAALKAKQDDLALTLISEENLKTPASDGDSAFVTAVKNGCLETMKNLMQPETMIFDHEKESLLHLGVRSGNTNVVKYLLDNGFAKFLNKPTNEIFGLTPIELALTGSNLQIVEMLLNQPNFKMPTNQLKTTLVHWAAKGSKEILDKMLSMSPSDNKPDFIGRSPLLYAIEAGNLENVKILASLDQASFSQKNVKQITSPLVIAINYGQFEIAKYLIQNYGKDLVNIADANGKTPLHALCGKTRLTEEQQMELTTLLINQGACIDSIDKEAKLPLHYLQVAFSTELPMTLLRGAPETLNKQDGQGMTLLHNAAQIGNLSLVMFLMSENARTDIKNNNGLTAIDLAEPIIREYFSFLQFCQDVKDLQLNKVEKNPNFTKFSTMQDFNGNTPLHLLVMNAATHGEDQKNKNFTLMLQMLVNNPKLLNLNVKNNQGETVLQTAIKHGDAKTIEFLLQNKNVNLFTQNNHGQNILHAMIYSPMSQSEQLRLISLMVHHAPALTYLKDKNKKNPLHHAVMLGNNKIIDLICNDANINARDSDGKTPLHLAVETGSISLIKTLIMHGANINVKNKSGQSPLDLAKNLNPLMETKILEISKMHAEQTRLNEELVTSILKQIEEKLPGGLKSLTSSLSKISKNQSVEEFNHSVLDRLEKELTSLTLKSDKKSFSLFAKNSKSIGTDPVYCAVSDIIKNFKTTTEKRFTH